MGRVRRLIEVIEALVRSGFTGYIRINFTQGAVGRIEKYEEIRDTAQSLLREKGERKDDRGTVTV